MIQRSSDGRQQTFNLMIYLGVRGSNPTYAHAHFFLSKWRQSLQNSESCNEKIGPPPKPVPPDQFWQPKLVPLCQFWSPHENVNSLAIKVAIAKYIYLAVQLGCSYKRFKTLPLWLAIAIPVLGIFFLEHSIVTFIYVWLLDSYI